VCNENNETYKQNTGTYAVFIKRVFYRRSSLHNGVRNFNHKSIEHKIRNKLLQNVIAVIPDFYIRRQCTLKIIKRKSIRTGHVARMDK